MSICLKLSKAFSIIFDADDHEVTLLVSGKASPPFWVINPQVSSAG